MWWASVGIIATHWQNGDTKKAEEHYVVIEELCEQRLVGSRGCTYTALHSDMGEI